MTAPLKSRDVSDRRFIEPSFAAGRRSPAAPDLVGLAHRRFVAGESCDIDSLAKELGVSRATAYRWAGNSEQLMGEVIASLVETTFRQAASKARGKGAARVLAVMERGMRYVAESRVYHDFLERDPQRALRIVATKEGPAQRRSIALHQQLLEDEVAKGHLRLSVDAHTMAYALVRTAESFLYADLIAGEKPDLAKALKILKLMLR